MSLHNSHFKDTPLRICVIDVIFIVFLHIFVELISLFSVNTTRKTTSHVTTSHLPVVNTKAQCTFYWQFHYDAPLTKKYNILSAVHCASVIIKKVRTSFETLDTRLPDTLCDANTEGKYDVRQGYSKWLWRKKPRLTQSTVIKWPAKRGFQETEVKLCVVIAGGLVP